MENKNLVWLDLEMTGLNPDKDAILEIAVVVTDTDLQVVAQGPDIVIHQPPSVLDAMSDVVRQLHTVSGLLERVRTSTVTVEQAEEMVLVFLKHHVPPGQSPLCGNSIYMDRLFLRCFMPRLERYMHYRVIDVSSLKELIMRWYPHNPHAFFPKQKAHRALDDVYESIAELKHYRSHFFMES